VPAFLRTVASRQRLTAERNILVATDLEHRLLGVRALPQRKASYDRRSRLAYDVLAPALERMLPARAHGSPPTGVGYIVRPREGRAVVTPEDHEWRYTLLWACGSICCFTGDVVIVTPHGWRCDDEAGWEPRLADLSRPPLKAVKAVS
jgi:hypothetical protein